jgi:fido (protein-threonine AMPylation protein)
MAIQFKHRLVSIHCFANGNGRHSRLMADLIIEKLYDSKVFSWGSANLVKATEARNNYIQAVRKADNHDIQPLIAFAKS